jgi:hypothetical protein
MAGKVTHKWAFKPGMRAGAYNLDGWNRLPEIIRGVEFRNSLRQLQTAA